MVLEPVECPVCGGTNVIKHGKSGEGKQRYLCQDPECHGKTFIREYSDLGRLVLEPVECPVCGGSNVIKHGKVGKGNRDIYVKIRRVMERRLFVTIQI